jgi:hypothetical protein
MKAAAPLASSFITYILGITSFTFLFRKARERLIQSKYVLASIFGVLGLAAGFVAIISNNNATWALDLQPPQEGNQPMGIAKGIYPGRVVWVYNTDATDENCANVSNDYWYMDSNTNQDVVDEMLSSGLQKMTGTNTDAAAWDSIFHYFNRNHGKGNIGYQPGEKFVIKINLNGIYNSSPDKNVNTSPQICYAILDQLVNIVGVAQTDISIGDPNCSMNSATYNKCHGGFPNVTYWGNGTGLTPAQQTSGPVIFGSDGSFADPLPQAYIDAAYMLNIPVFKKHHRAGISLCCKNHFGSIAPYTSGAWHLHPSLPVPNANEGTDTVTNYQYGVYRCFVDIMGHKDLGGKTIFYLIDGIWGSVNWGHPPVKWGMTPFNNDWPNSLFLSQDPVAIESVGYDFLYEEFDEDHPTEGGTVTTDKGPFPHFKATDDYLHQAADPANWPSGIEYDPENDGSILTSMGTHEHWNNAIDKKYTRNLGTGDGIELMKIFLNTQITPDNSELLSEKVTSIFVDSFNVKWFGTDMGISRYDELDWTSITTDDYLLNNNIRKLAYERTAYGHEIWAATEGGLSVLGIDVDGVTSATTYTTGNSDIINNDILSVGVDIRHNRWAGTPVGLSVFRGSDWYDTSLYLNENHSWQSLADLTITSFGSYEKDSMIFITTDSAGVLRYDFDLIDGFTGASAYGEQWTPLESNTVNTVTITDTIQWFGTPQGAFKHYGNETKINWETYTTDSGLISSNVRAIEIDDDGNIWFGTDKGLSIKTESGWFQYPAGIQASGLSFNAGSDSVAITWTIGTGIGEGTGLINPVVNDIKKDFSGVVWVATDGGIEFFSEVPTTYSSDYIAKRVVFLKVGNSGILIPVNGITYTASSVFGEGSQLSGWYCVYNGTESAVTVTGLTPETEYRVFVFEYYGDPGSEVYATNSSTGNPANFTTTNMIDNIDLDTGIELTVYPVPFGDYIVISTGVAAKDMILAIYSLDGKLCYTTIISGRESRINTSGLSKGSYILQVRIENKNYNTKILKQ